jgi:dihydrofolate reductase
VIGGAEIYALFEPRLTRIELTEVHEDAPGDVVTPYPGPEWVETSREERPADDKWPAHSFVTLVRK